MFLIWDFKFNINQLSTLQWMVHSYKRITYWELRRCQSNGFERKDMFYFSREKKINFNSGTYARCTTKVGPNQPWETSPGQYRDTPFPLKEEPLFPRCCLGDIHLTSSLPQMVEGSTLPHHELDRDLGVLREKRWVCHIQEHNYEGNSTGHSRNRNTCLSGIHQGRKFKEHGPAMDVALG